MSRTRPTCANPPQVYLGTMNETSVAVKVLADTSGASAAGSWASSPALQALHRESSVMAALRHPNVVSHVGCAGRRVIQLPCKQALLCSSACMQVRQA